MKLPFAPFVLAGVALLSAIIVVAAVPATAPVSQPAPARVPVLLELFTSEGCSSCPPADKVLQALDRQPLAGADLIVLSEHVDYWNYLGWKDPYSSPVFTQREQKYSDQLGESVYTPQLVIDGQVQLVGSDQREILQSIARAVLRPKLSVSVTVEGSGASGGIHVEANSGGRNADLYIAIAADRMQTQVLRGENGGHVLTHVAVAQSLTRIGKWDGTGLSRRDLPFPSRPAGAALPRATRVIAILQDPETGRILGVAQTKI
jgi:hypothetical protein